MLCLGNLLLHAGRQSFAEAPYLIAYGKQCETVHSADFSFCGICVIKHLRIEQMRCQGDGFLVYCKTAVPYSSLDIFYDVARIRGNDLYLLTVLEVVPVFADLAAILFVYSHYFTESRTCGWVGVSFDVLVH